MSSTKSSSLKLVKCAISARRLRLDVPGDRRYVVARFDVFDARRHGRRHKQRVAAAAAAAFARFACRSQLLCIFVDCQRRTQKNNTHSQEAREIFFVGRRVRIFPICSDRRRLPLAFPSLHKPARARVLTDVDAVEIVESNELKRRPNERRARRRARDHFFEQTRAETPAAEREQRSQRRIDAFERVNAC